MKSYFSGYNALLLLPLLLVRFNFNPYSNLSSDLLSKDAMMNDFSFRKAPHFGTEFTSSLFLSALLVSVTRTSGKQNRKNSLAQLQPLHLTDINITSSTDRLPYALVDACIHGYTYIIHALLHQFIHPAINTCIGISMYLYSVHRLIDRSSRSCIGSSMHRCHSCQSH